jgi:hypothetical protein
VEGEAAARALCSLNWDWEHDLSLTAMLGWFEVAQRRLTRLMLFVDRKCHSVCDSGKLDLEKLRWSEKIFAVVAGTECGEHTDWTLQ